jgi:EmrB/QacA subfamily drug resistance transporter
MATATSQPSPSFLATRRGRLTLTLLCAVAFLDFVDATIVNVAMPSIGSHLHFSVQNLQWVLSAYLVTYGGFLLLGGRAADLIGRRRMLVAGTALFAAASLTCGLANSAGLLVGARLVQGIGAAAMSPAAMSLLTTKFHEGNDRFKALGAWSAMIGLASASGMILGGVLSQSIGWRWVFFVNVPVCVLIIAGIYRLLDDDRPESRPSRFDTPGAVLATAGMLLLIYGLVRAPEIGWGAGRTIGALAGAVVLLVGFVINEQRHSNPLAPMSIFRIKGVGAADLTQVLATAGFYAAFFFITLYMQNVLGYGQIASGSAYLPVTVGFGVSSAVVAKLFPRTGTRPVIVGGSIIAAGAIFWLSRIPVHGHYASDLLPGLAIMALGLGAVFTGVQTAANAGVPQEQSGLAAALITSSFQLGGALGLAVFSAIATSRTNHLIHSGTAAPDALTSGFQRALVACSIALVVAALIALRTSSTRATPMPPAEVPSATDPAPESVGS